MNEQDREFMASLEGMKHQVSLGYYDFYHSFARKERGEHVNDYEFLYRAKIWLSQLFVFFESSSAQKDFIQKVKSVNDDNVVNAFVKTDKPFLKKLERLRDVSFSEVKNLNEDEKEIESFIMNKNLLNRAMEVSELLCL